MFHRCPTSARPGIKPLRRRSLTLWRCLSLWSTVPSSGALLCQRAELNMEMRNFGAAVQDASSLCRMRPFWTKVRGVLDPEGSALTLAGV